MPPRDKKPRKKAGGDAPVKRVTHDSRFSHVQDDPRFRRPSKNQAKVKVDKRFAHMIRDKDFTETTRVDRYGRVQEDNRAKAHLKSTYDFGSSDDGEEGSDSEEDSNGDDEDSGSGEDSGGEEESGSGEEDSGSEEDGSDAVSVDRARGRGVASDSSSDSEDDSDISDVDWGKYGGGQNGGLSDLEEDPDSIPRGDETKRFACINMDWDHVRAIDLYTVFSGFKPDSGAILSVRVYPSEFGAERMAREAVEGPPRELFAAPRARHSSDSDSDSDSNSGSGSDSDADSVDLVKEQVKNNDEIDQVALRKYELEKMRYYFAVVECDSVATAQAICGQCDGTEYEASANFFDLRFIPDDMTFDQAPRDEATHMPENYKPVEFSTQALKHSKVQLTWDADEPSRVKATRRAFTQDEVDEMDFGKLLASSSDDSSSGDEQDMERKRALLLSGGGDGDGSESGDDGDGKDAALGDLEITFAPGLSEAASARLEAKKQQANTAKRAEETPIERFRRLKQEKRERWRESRKAAKAGHGSGGKNNKDDSDSDNLVSGNELGADVAGDSFFTYEDEDRLMPAKAGKANGGKANGGKAKGGKAETKAERKQRMEAEAKERAELELLLDGPESGRKHFDLDEIVKAEKRKGRKGKGKGKGGKKPDVEDDFELNVSDPRFGALFDSHNFAIDPNNPNFKKTKAMKELLSESRKRRKSAHD